MSKTYSGTEIDVTFDMKRCIHARNCFLKLPKVFDPAQRPWVNPDAASADEVAAMIRTCPSGALGYVRKDGVAAEAKPGINRMSVLENGPNAIHGNLSVQEDTMTRATLCRCGKTQNPPYCDYSHVAAEFQATGEPKETGKEVKSDAPDAELQLIGHEDGPLEARGPLEITSGTGKRLHSGERAFLCRCGASENKPFCDGSHKKTGFKVPAT